MCCAETTLVVYLGKEVADNIDLYSKHALICRFCQLWPSFPDLHLWITNHWSPLVDGPMEVYPSTQGFFVVGFSSPKDRQSCIRSWSVGLGFSFLKALGPFF